MSSKHLGLEIKSATLWVFISEATRSSGENKQAMYKLVLWRRFKGKEARDVMAKERFHSKQLNTTGWHSFDVSFLVKEWFSQHRTSDLSLEIETKGLKSLVVGGMTNGDPEANQPFLLVDTKEKKTVSRKRRSFQLRKCNKTEPRNCCRKSMFEIDFKAIGWNFVIAPKVLTTFTCAGVCARSSIYGDLQWRAQALINLNQFQTVCCRPNELLPMSMMILTEDGTPEYIYLPKMQVKSCHCIVWLGYNCLRLLPPVISIDL